mmetsp:Transcript_27810/g.26864  ORF Transcript_27810/g.26864 Transcript_27810/m.26864 type:complete len:84 (-) Transcript_27810:761-1012(-)
MLANTFSKKLNVQEDNARRGTEISKSSLSLEHIETSSILQFKFNVKSVNDVVRALINLNKFHRNCLTYDRLQQDDFKKILKQM